VGIIISLILIAVGAILTFAVNQSSSGTVDIDVVGVVLMIIGFVLFLLSLMLWRTWWGAGFWGAGPGPYDDGGEVVVRRRYARPTRRRTTYVEDEPPPGPPA
jgi:Na+/melibiose symporter-like transporter